MSDVPVVGSFWFKRYPLFNVCVVQVVKVDDDQVTYCDEDDVDLGRYDADKATTLSLPEFHSQYHILGDAS